MRLWSIHPCYLDAKGLVAVWREGLLAQAVLLGKTKGYVQHPQLLRFRASSSPMASIAAYLHAVHQESVRRNYRFDTNRIVGDAKAELIDVSRGQLHYEWQHLLHKLEVRDPQRHAQLCAVASPETHPLFRLVEGGVAQWEKIQHRD